MKELYSPFFLSKRKVRDLKILFEYMTKTYTYIIGKAADDPGWFGVFYRRNRYATANGTDIELAQRLGVLPYQIYDGNVITSNLSPRKLSRTS